MSPTVANHFLLVLNTQVNWYVDKATSAHKRDNHSWDWKPLGNITKSKTQMNGGFQSARRGRRKWLWKLKTNKKSVKNKISESLKTSAQRKSEVIKAILNLYIWYNLKRLIVFFSSSRHTSRGMSVLGMTLRREKNNKKTKISYLFIRKKKNQRPKNRTTSIIISPPSLITHHSCLFTLLFFTGYYQNFQKEKN